MYGDWQVGAFTAEEYVREATRWARAIRMLDPRAKLVSCGMNGWNEWDRVVIDGMSSLVDYHSLHIYTGSDDYWTNVLQPHQAERAIRCTRALIERAAYRQKLAAPPRIAYDEWNVWYRQMTGALSADGASAADEAAEAGFLVGSAPNGMARIDPHTPVKPGGRVTFTVDPARLYFFDPDTGQAITG
jgi:alpha-L-arabinofuranosidase